MIIGGVAGFEIDRHGFQNNDSHFGKTRFVNYVTKELGLTANQQRQLDSVIDYAHPRFQTIRKKFNTDMQTEMDSTQNMINNILTSEQQSKFRVLFAKIESNRNQQDSK
jgi:hypothetical protein